MIGFQLRHRASIAFGWAAGTRVTHGSFSVSVGLLCAGFVGRLRVFLWRRRAIFIKHLRFAGWPTPWGAREHVDNA